MTTTTARGPGRPREDHVPSESGICERHGKVEMRFHKARVRADGSQAYSRRCPDCHNERNQGYAK